MARILIVDDVKEVRQAMKRALEDDNPDNDVAAIGKLNAFVKEVEAQRGKKITDENAGELTTSALFIIGLLEDDLFG